ncbi:MAG: PhoX family phosphatase, partial [Rhizobacter sp.]
MKNDVQNLSVDHDDIDLNHSGNDSFLTVLDARLSRRSVLRGGVGTAATAVLATWSLAACGGDDDETPAPVGNAPITSLAFAAVAKSTADTVVVPAGYTAAPIYALGDPIAAGVAAYKNDGTDTDMDKRAGDHHDGMEYFGLAATGNTSDANNSDRGLLAMNHEATSNADVRSFYLHANGGTVNPRPASEALKEIDIHGLSVVEVKKTAGKWAYVQDGALNRRVTPFTELALSGPVRGNALVKTKYSADGTKIRGTINNCGTGRTPWGTFLTGEENWAGYFTRNRTGHTTDNTIRNDKSVVSLNRYGVSQTATSRHGWETVPATGDAAQDDRAARFFIGKTGVSTDGTDDYRNELNGFGYIVEMDVFDKVVAVKKRTGLGRFAHESAAFGKVVAGKPLAVYMGDDSRGEYIYKFVSTKTWNAADANPTNRITTGDAYLDTGKLYVAKFAADGSGTWIELNIANTAIAGYATYAFADQADVLVNARLAADAVGATKMDRPEWCAVHPTTGEIYYTLTNNSNRSAVAGAAQFVDGPNPRSYTDVKGTSNQTGNPNGHIIRMAETAGEAASLTFKWDVYLFGAQAVADGPTPPAANNLANTQINLSALTNDNDFSSPDGLWFSQNTGLCWIQTDDGAYTDKTNCMMLVGVPGTVGDGAKTTLNYTRADGTTLAIDTFVGKQPVASTLKRFLVGPVECELTGCTETPDGKTLFANIQHPGENVANVSDVTDPTKYPSRWPGNAGYQAVAGNMTSRPRSATL